MRTPGWTSSPVPAEEVARRPATPMEAYLELVCKAEDIATLLQGRHRQLQEELVKAQAELLDVERALAGLRAFIAPKEPS